MWYFWSKRQAFLQPVPCQAVKHAKGEAPCKLLTIFSPRYDGSATNLELWTIAGMHADN